MLQMLIRFDFFISPGSLGKTGFFLHLRTEVPEDHQGTEVAPGQWRRAAGMGWAGLGWADGTVLQEGPIAGAADKSHWFPTLSTHFSLPLWIWGEKWGY